mgnify:CR=1 FL=1
MIRKGWGMRTTAAVTVTLGIVLGLGACAKPNYVISEPQAFAPQAWSASRVTPHVLIVSIDGLRPEHDAQELTLLAMPHARVSVAVTRQTPNGEPVGGWIQWRDGDEWLISYGLTC